MPRRVHVCTRVAAQVQRRDEKLRLRVVTGGVVVVEDLDSRRGQGSIGFHALHHRMAEVNQVGHLASMRNAGCIAGDLYDRLMPFTTRPELKGTFGMVSSTHWLATQCGMAMLESGGNAFDAAVTAGFVL